MLLQPCELKETKDTNIALLSAVVKPATDIPTTTHCSVCAFVITGLHISQFSEDNKVEMRYILVMTMILH